MPARPSVVLAHVVDDLAVVGERARANQDLLREIDAFTRALDPRVVQVSATSDGRSLVLQPEQGAAITWPMADLRAVEDAADRLVLTIHHAGDLAEARLSLSDPALIAWVRTAAPDLRRRDVAAGTLPRVALRVAAALGAVALILFVLLPAISDRLAAALPREQEVAFGRAVVRQMSELLGEGQAALVCDSPMGAAALERMVARLTEGQDLGYDLQVSVIDSPDSVSLVMPPTATTTITSRATSRARSTGSCTHAPTNSSCANPNATVR